MTADLDPHIATTSFSHRNGEAEPPTVEGFYWLHQDGLDGDVVHVVWQAEIRYKGKVDIRAGWIISGERDHYVDELADAQWWGPIVAPWHTPTTPPPVDATSPLPCPFCGTTPDLWDTDQLIADEDGEWAHIWCEKCSASGPAIETNGREFADCLDDCIAAWNRRTTTLVRPLGPAQPQPMPFHYSQVRGLLQHDPDEPPSEEVVRRLRGHAPDPRWPVKRDDEDEQQRPPAARGE